VPTPLTHGLVGAAVAQCLPSKAPRWKAGLLFAFLAVLPDFDIVTFHLGIRYGDMLGHRGLTHSLVFAVASGAVGALVFLCLNRLELPSAVGFASLAVVAALSHGILDAATSGGLGVGFFLPFDDQRFFFHMRPIAVSPINPAKFAASAYAVLKSEAVWVWLPLAFMSGAFRAGRFLIPCIKSFVAQYGGGEA